MGRAVRQRFRRAGGGLEALGRRRQSDTALSFNVTRCGYAEFFRSLGLAELGFLFCCNRDFAMVEGFNPGLSLSRTQTLMLGRRPLQFPLRAEESDVQDPGGLVAGAGDLA